MLKFYTVQHLKVTTNTQRLQTLRIVYITGARYYVQCSDMCYVQRAGRGRAAS